jgi:hypothetical protein
MGTPTLSTAIRRGMPIMLAIALGLLMTAWVTGTARAGGNCSVTVDPETVPVGGQYVVSGNFGGAEIHLVRGENVSTPEDSQPVATVPQSQASFDVTITAGPGSEGVWTVWGFIEGSECGDSALVTVTGVPDTAMDAGGLPLATAVGALLLALATASLFLIRASRRQPS